MSGYVYAIECGDAVKIGWANDPLRRLSELQVAHPAPLKLIGFKEADGEHHETAAHERLRSERIRGEWFRKCGSVLAFLDELTVSGATIPPRPFARGVSAFPIIEKVGGLESAIRIIAKAIGKEPTSFVMQKWVSKKALPSKAAIALIFECQRLGIETSESDLDWPRENVDAA